MSDINDGGPAFPFGALAPEGERAILQTIYKDNEGMSLRDYFAGQALHGFCALTGFNYENGAFAAAKAYELADAMLKAREAK